MENSQILSSHFSLSEFVVSQTATRLDIDNVPTQEIIDALKLLCQHVLEPLRVALGPVIISSGYRSPKLNSVIGGSTTSQHCYGEAADIIVRNISCDHAAWWIHQNCQFDQLIREFPPAGWVHVSYKKDRLRAQSLIANKVNSKTVYALWVPKGEHN